MKNKVLSERALLSLCIALGTAQVWISRYAMNQDGTSYLDVGDAYLRHDWASAISGYWSPMYPWLLGSALHLFKPSLWWESITVHVVNWAIYIMALFSFRFFLRSVLCALSDEDAPSEGDSFPLPDWILSGLGYAIFLWASLVLIDTGDVTPDLLVEAFLFLIGGYLVDLRSNDSYGKFARFGILCGAAYLAKAVMFPVGVCLLAILLFSAKRSKRRVWGVFLAAMLFIVVSSPYIAALSQQKGRFTFGDSGKLTYAAMVSPNVPQKHWQGETTGGGTPQHPTRQLLEHPPVFEFAVPIGGTYPPWYDPSDWNEGAHGTFRLRAQIRVFVESLRKVYKHVAPPIGTVGRNTGLYLLGRVADVKSDPFKLATDTSGCSDHRRLLFGARNAAICGRFLGIVVRCYFGRETSTEERTDWAVDKICRHRDDRHHIVFSCRLSSGHRLYNDDCLWLPNAKGPEKPQRDCNRWDCTRVTQLRLSVTELSITGHGWDGSRL